MQLKNKKIAIIHDSFTHLGGAEKVLFNLVRIFPGADIYTSLIKEEYLKKIKTMSRGNVYYSKLSHFKFALNYPDIFKPYVLFYWNFINLNKYDLVISSSGSFSSNWVTVKKIHISYIHTPPKYLYKEYNEMYFLKKFPLKQLLFPFFEIIRKIDYKKLHKVNTLIASSINIQKRIKKYYQRSSTIIYPSINHIQNKQDNKTKKNYYLFFSRLVQQKGCELAINTFNQNGKKLIVVGTGKQYKKLKKIANKNIIFKNFVKDNQLEKIFSKSKALIYCSIDEDFGLVPLESMSFGVPVISYRSGGTLETVLENKTGIFYDKYDSKSLNDAINKFETINIKSSVCKKWASNFCFSLFKIKILNLINSL